MSTYNDARYLPGAIESILGQSLQDFELIIIDDHSADETPEALANYIQRDSRIRVIRNERNVGVARSLNRGIEVARGELIARMDSDDISLPERFDKQVAFLDAHPEVGVLGTQTLFIDESGQLFRQAEWEKPTSHNSLVWQLFYATPICHPSVMMRTECLRSVGGYSPDYPNEDMQLWTRMALTTKLANLDDILLHYRMPPEELIQKLSYWEPQVQRVGREYAERLTNHNIDPELARIFFIFQHYNGHIEEGVTLSQIFQVCCMLEDVFNGMRNRGLFELDDVETVENLLFHQTQRLVSVAFKKCI